MNSKRAIDDLSAGIYCFFVALVLSHFVGNVSYVKHIRMRKEAKFHLPVCQGHYAAKTSYYVITNTQRSRFLFNPIRLGSFKGIFENHLLAEPGGFPKIQASVLIRDSDIANFLN